MIVDKVRKQSRAAKDTFESDVPVKGKGKAGSRAAAAPRSRTAAPKGSGTAARAAASKGESAGKGAIAAASEGPAVIAACPRPGCGGSLFMGRKGYGCSHYREGCKFVIWKESFGRSLTDTQIKALAEKGRTAKLKLTLADGAVMDGKLVLRNSETGELAVEQV
jgi:DNA topoisomerase-3